MQCWHEDDKPQHVPTWLAVVCCVVVAPFIGIGGGMLTMWIVEALR